MRDILNSNKGRTKSQRDYGRDAGEYVPVLERRPLHTFTRPVSRGWDSGALAHLQERHASIVRETNSGTPDDAPEYL